MNSPDHAVPMGQKRRRIIGNAVGEGCIELEVRSISGECMLTLNVENSMLGCDLWRMILDKVPSKPGQQLVVSHTSKLALHKSLQQQGLRGQWAHVSATYMPVNLHAAWRFAHGHRVEDAEFSLNGITEVKGADEATSALLRNLPKSLRTLTFACDLADFNQPLHHVGLPEGLETLTFGYHFNQMLDNVTWPARLQTLTFGWRFNQSLDNVTWPAGLQTLTFGDDFNQRLDNVTWPAGLQSLTFGWRFNQSLDNVTWPAGLETLTFGRDFNQRLDNVTWPAGLQSLTFMENLESLQDLGVLPGSLAYLAIEKMALTCWNKNWEKESSGKELNHFPQMHPNTVQPGLGIRMIMTVIMMMMMVVMMMNCYYYVSKL